MMNDAKPGKSSGYWTSLPVLTHVERLEAACQQVILRTGDVEARSALGDLLHLDLGSGLDPLSPASTLVKLATEQIHTVASILDEEKPDVMALRVATARLCQTLTTMRGHLSGGRRLIGAAPIQMPTGAAH